MTREGSVDLDNLTFTAIKREDIDLTQGVYPFDFSKAVNFSMASDSERAKRQVESMCKSYHAIAESNISYCYS